MLDERVSEKASADLIVVFFENMHEEDSVNEESQTWNRLAHGTREEQCKHLDNARNVQQSIWQLQILCHECADVLHLLLNGPMHAYSCRILFGEFRA